MLTLNKEFLIFNYIYWLIDIVYIDKEEKGEDWKN